MPDKHSTASLPHFIITVTSFVYHFFGNLNTQVIVCNRKGWNLSPLRLLRHFHDEVSNHHSQIIDVKNSIHVRVFQVGRTLHLMDATGQLEEFRESQLGNIVQTFRFVPLEDVPIPFARVAFLTRADTVIGWVKKFLTSFSFCLSCQVEDDLENYAISGEYLRLNSPPTLQTSFETRLMKFRYYLEKIKPGLSIGRGYSILRP